MEYFFMGAGAALIIACLAAYLQFSRTHIVPTAKKNDGPPRMVNCPLCSSHLARGEDIFTKVWRPMSVPEQRIAVFGCPHCYPRAEPGVTRKCPVCRESVDTKEHLVAHLFNLPTGKKHITVTGCTHCVKCER